jgi:hypothetical protein
MTVRTFDFSKQCCFCGANNEKGTVGYGGERCCPTCGKGGDGEPDEAWMAYKSIVAKTKAEARIQ